MYTHKHKQTHTHTHNFRVFISIKYTAVALNNKESQLYAFAYIARGVYAIHMNAHEATLNNLGK